MRFTVVANQVFSQLLELGALGPQKFVIPVTWFEQRTAPGTYESLLGDTSALAAFDSTIGSISLDDLRFHHIPDVSEADFIVFSSKQTGRFQIAFSQDQFDSVGLIQLDALSAKTTGPSQCGDTSSALNGIVVYKESLLIVTGSKAISGKLENSTIVLDDLLDECTSEIEPHPQLPAFNSSDCSFTLIFGKPKDRVWLTTTETAQELLDSNNRTMYQFMNLNRGEAIFVDGTSSSVQCTSFKFLVAANGRYYLLSFDISNKAWSILFEFPVAVLRSRIDIPSGYSRRIYNYKDLSIQSKAYLSDFTTDSVDPTNESAWLKLNLTGIDFHRSISDDLPDGGASFVLLKAFTDGSVINAFDGASNGWFVIGTTENESLFGKIGSVELTQVNPKRISLDTRFIPFFDENDRLFELRIGTAGYPTNPPTISRSLIDLEAIQGILEVTTETPCPYSSIAFSYPKDPGILRYIPGEGNTELPEKIFLERHESFNFSVIIFPSSAEINLDSLEISFQVSDKSVSISPDRVVDYFLRRVRYDITVTESGEVREQEEPGVNLQPTVLRMFVTGGNLACEHVVSSGATQKKAVEYSTVIYTGCPPYQTTELLSEVYKDSEGCPDPDNGIPCIFFDNDFYPHFTVTDQVTKITTDYTGMYTLLIVGGGGTLESITYYDEKKSDYVNPNNSITAADQIVWAPIFETDFVAGVPAFNYSTTGIQWVCAASSPCYGVLPRSGSPTPEYYFVLEMSTGMANTEASFCLRRATFIIKIYGLPLSFMIQCILTFGTFGFCIMVLLGLLLYAFMKQLKSQKANMGRVFPMDGPGGMEGIFGDGPMMPEPSNRAASVDPEGNRGNLEKIEGIKSLFSNLDLGPAGNVPPPPPEFEEVEQSISADRRHSIAMNARRLSRAFVPQNSPRLQGSTGSGPGDVRRRPPQSNLAKLRETE
ncbi:hypothetical protein BJ742DRAFT_772234 [Cladochytrium replicatum]|nr:hypothetical protein BJ742DRAFT_772234 [Cladochytrium replicatum]